MPSKAWAEISFIITSSHPPRKAHKLEIWANHSKEVHLNHGFNELIQKKIRVLRAEKLSKNCPNLAKFLEYTYLAVVGRFLGPMYSDLFLDCFVETVVQMRFFWVQRSLLFGQLKFWLIEGLRGSGPPKYQHFRPLLEFLVFSSHLYTPKGPRKRMTTFQIPT